MKHARFALFFVLSLCLFDLAGAQALPQGKIAIQQIFHQSRLQGPPPQDLEWTPDGTRLTYIDSAGNLMEISGVSGSRNVLVGRDKMHPLLGGGISERDHDHRARYHQPDYIWAPDSKHLLFDSDGELWFFNTANGVGLELASTGAGSGDDPQFSPDGAYLSYIRDHNLYVRKMSETQFVVKLTDSRDDTVLDGEVDWVYEEELDVRSNYSWSPDSKRIAYLQMNETDVPEYPITDWMASHPAVYKQRYPEAGDLNPAVRVGVVGANGGRTKWIDLPIDSGNDYIPRFGWINDRMLWIEVLSRDQTKLTLYFAEPANGAVESALTLKDNKFLDESYDVDLDAPDILLTSWQDGHNHIYHYRFNPENPGPATLVKQVTMGPWEVSRICALDRETQTIYYLSNEGSPLQQRLWAVKLDGGGKRLVSGSDGWHDPVFSSNAKSFADTISSVTTPPVVDLCREETHCRAVWKAAPIGVTLIAPIPLEVKASDGKTTLYGQLILPVDETAPKTVPLIVNPYGGPQGQTVTDEWNGRTLLFDQVLAQHGFAVLHVDNRGTGGRGRDFAQAAYRNFGPVQFGDQIAALDQVLARYPQLDAKRLGWWGWSWGGTFTLYAMTHSDRFRAGVAVAPVTDWRNYDSIYTERYLGEPINNPDGYRDDSVVNNAADLKGRLLLIHGTGDENVHLGNSIQFIQRLIDANIPYDLQLYPGKTHSIYGADARTHLYSRILAHFERYLMNAPDAEEQSAAPAGAKAVAAQ